MSDDRETTMSDEWVLEWQRHYWEEWQATTRKPGDYIEGVAHNRWKHKTTGATQPARVDDDGRLLPPEPLNGFGEAVAELWGSPDYLVGYSNRPDRPRTIPYEGDADEYLHNEFAGFPHIRVRVRSPQTARASDTANETANQPNPAPAHIKAQLVDGLRGRWECLRQADGCTRWDMDIAADYIATIDIRECEAVGEIRCGHRAGTTVKHTTVRATREGDGDHYIRICAERLSVKVEAVREMVGRLQGGE